MKIIFYFILFFLVVFFCRCKKDKNELPSSLTKYELTYPNYVPQPFYTKYKELTQEGVDLGRRLYYDPILSNNGQSCGSCHSQQLAFTSSSQNSLPHFNLAWFDYFLWNGYVEGDLHEAMKFEVGHFFNTDVSKLNASSYYKSLFKTIYGTDNITQDLISDALAQFICTIQSFNSPFDQYLRKEKMITLSQLNGFYIFNSEKGDCFHCHSVGLFTDTKFRNNGLDDGFNSTNSGRFNVTGKASDIGLYKTPTLRNIELTAPYMHDGRYNTLEEVVEFYNSGIKYSPTLDPIMFNPSFQDGLQLTTSEKNDLIEFLKALTDSTLITNPMFAPM